MPFIDLDLLPTKEVIPGYTARSFHTGTMTFMYWTVKAGAVMPMHAHLHEQVANVLHGTFELTIEGETRLLKPGIAAVIPPNTFHGGKAITDCELLDVFNPERDDYKFKIMNIDLKNKTALVCGGSQGLGLASAKELALLGATIVLVSRNEEKLQNSIQQLDASAGQQHTYLAIDLSDPAHAKAAVETWLSKGATIHILINNAGGPPSGPMIDTDPLELDKAFKTHVVSSHVLAQLVIPGMRKAGYGRIINIVSTSVKQPINGLGISNTIRAAVANWSKTLANEIGNGGITINNVLPGFTNTDRLDYLFTRQAADQGVDKQAILERSIASIPAKRLGEPEEFGAVVAFLCTPAAAYINGINLPVDGGRTGCT